MGKLLVMTSAMCLIALPSAPAIAGEDKAPAPQAPQVVDKNHPDYMRCRTESVIGSRAKKVRVCLTNREWAEVARNGKAYAARMVEDSRAGMLTN